MTNKFDTEITIEAIKRLGLEQSWLDASRSHFRADDSVYLQLAFAEHVNSANPIDVIRQFYLCVKKGATPPAKLLIAVAQSFEGYDKAGGEKSIDEFFGHIKKQGKKDPLKQELKDNFKWQVYWFMWSQMKQAELAGRELTILAAAANAVDVLKPHKSRDSLEKEYISAKAKQVFDQAYDAIYETAPEMVERMLDVENKHQG